MGPLNGGSLIAGKIDRTVFRKHVFKGLGKNHRPPAERVV